METKRTPSAQQLKIFDWFKSGKDNLVVSALAGTGKTTTILRGIDLAKEPRILLAAFNKRIAEELTAKLKNPNAEALTLHSVGFKAVRRYWNTVQIDSKNERRWNLASRASPHAPDPITSLAAKLASVAKGAAPFGSVRDLVDLAVDFDLTPDPEWEDEGWTTEKVAIIAYRAMDLACQRDGTIDFDDMCFVPVRNGWIRPTYGLVVIDECQDMNATQILIAQRSCSKYGRICVVGDRHQAIYGFRGADSGSLDRLKKELNAAELPLTVTYRCPKTVVEEARVYVPEYEAAESAPDGSVTTATAEQMLETVTPGDFILSRKNAPLARFCMKLLRAGKRAKIEGKDIGAGLLAIIKKVKGRSIVDFLERLEVYRGKQALKIAVGTRSGGEEHAAGLVSQMDDKVETLKVLAEDLGSIAELEARLKNLFENTAGGSFIILSSVHKAKGLEADRVFLIADTFRTTTQEEINIKYVAITRAKSQLVWVPGTEPKKEKSESGI